MFQVRIHGRGGQGVVTNTNKGFAELGLGEMVKGGAVKVGRNMMTGHPGIFAGGDMVPAERNITVAIGHGKKAARS